MKLLKQLLLSCLAGVALTAIVMATPNVNAACQGFCADIYLKNGCQLGYAGCTISYDAKHQPENVECFYTGACDPPLNQ